jgi:hypothetical protein
MQVEKPKLPRDVVWCEECDSTHLPDDDTRDCTGRWFKLTLGTEVERDWSTHCDRLPVAYVSDEGRVKLHVRPKEEHDVQDTFDMRLDETARQYIATFDGRRAGIVVKLFHPGMVAARGCVGGSFKGWWEWYFFNDDQNGPDASSDRITKIPRSIEWELTRSERYVSALRTEA